MSHAIRSMLSRRKISWRRLPTSLGKVWTCISYAVCNEMVGISTEREARLPDVPTTVGISRGLITNYCHL